MPLPQLLKWSNHSFNTKHYKILSAIELNLLHRQIISIEQCIALANGQIIEDYPDDKYGASCLVSGLTQDERPIHIHCSYPSRPLVKIITLYEPSPQRWNEDFTQRISK